MVRVLVAFYSSAGTTHKVAQAIAAELSADVEEIRAVHPVVADLKGKGLRNFLNMGRVVLPALRRRPVPIQPVQYDPAEYDLVIIGTPVYAASLSGPARAYLAENAKFRQVAFFSSGLDPKPQQKVFEQMEQACGKAPKAVYSFHADKVVADEFIPQVKEFAAKLHQA